MPAPSATTPARRTYPLVEARPRAIVIHCSDPRFQRAFTEFIRNDLHLADGETVPFVIAGGAAPLSEPLRLPKEFKFMKERIELFLDAFDSINRIVLINHEDCRYYEALRQALGSLFLSRVKHLTERQMNDLRAVGKLILSFTRPGLSVELYYARLRQGGGIEFEQVAAV